MYPFMLIYEAYFNIKIYPHFKQFSMFDKREFNINSFVLPFKPCLFDTMVCLSKYLIFI